MLAHNIWIAGYPARELLDRPASIANHVARMGPGDALVVCSYWRLYDVAVTAAEEAHRRGATVVVLADNVSTPLREVADEVLLCPAEGTSFFPSLSAAVAVAQGLVATLASLDPDRTRAAMAASESGWETFELLHHSVPRR